MSQTYAELIFDRIRSRGWSVGMFSFWQHGRRLWSADATKGDGERIIVQTEVLAAALLELEGQCAEAE